MNDWSQTPRVVGWIGFSLVLASLLGWIVAAQYFTRASAGEIVEQRQSGSATTFVVIKSVPRAVRVSVAVLACVGLVFVAVSLLMRNRSDAERLPAPSGRLTVAAEIAGEEAGPTRRNCVRLRFEDAAAHKTASIQTGVSNGMKWAIGWHDADTVVLYSSDIGMLAFDYVNGSVVERQSDEAEKETSRAAYEQKYGRRPQS